MAYMSQEKKAKIAPVVKAICKKYGVKASLAVRNHFTLSLNVSQGPIDFIENYIKTDEDRPYIRKMDERSISFLRKNRAIDVNVYHYKDQFSGKALSFLKEVIPAMNDGNHDRSDPQSDYFDVGWYSDVNIGNWKKPYTLVK